jgi:hypothetical protein
MEEGARGAGMLGSRIAGAAALLLSFRPVLRLLRLSLFLFLFLHVCRSLSRLGFAAAAAERAPPSLPCFPCSFFSVLLFFLFSS